MGIGIRSPGGSDLGTRREKGMKNALKSPFKTINVESAKLIIFLDHEIIPEEICGSGDRRPSNEPKPLLTARILGRIHVLPENAKRASAEKDTGRPVSSCCAIASFLNSLRIIKWNEGFIRSLLKWSK